MANADVRESHEFFSLITESVHSQSWFRLKIDAFTQPRAMADGYGRWPMAKGKGRGLSLIHI